MRQRVSLSCIGFATALVVGGCAQEERLPSIEDIGAGAPAILQASGADADDDGILDSQEAPGDNDSDGLDNVNDPDDDNDGIPTARELEASLLLGTANPDGDGFAAWYDPDSDNDGLRDLEEGDVDTDGDLIPDFLEADDDGDGRLTADELADQALHGSDVDGDLIPNYLDPDSDGDSVLDRDEAQGDVNNNGIPNYLDADDDGDGVPTSVEVALTTAGNDPDQDGAANWYDSDSDDDGLADGLEQAGIIAIDTDNDGIADFIDSDDDGDGIATSVERAESIPLGDIDGDSVAAWFDDDSDGDGRPDSEEGSADVDNDGIRNFLDTDDDNDSLSTADEVLNGLGLNVDGDDDGLPDWYDQDSDGDGIGDAVEGFADRNGNGVSAFVDATEAVDPSFDSDGDSLADGVEIVLGTDIASLDSDADGIADAVETNGGDAVNTDDDGLIDALDTDADDDGLSDLTEGLLDPYGREIGMWRSNDDDGDGLLTADERAASAIFGDDIDHDGIPNWLDQDSDGTGGFDSEEGDEDSDSDGIPNYLDASDEAPTDHDADGVSTADELTNGTNPLEIDTDGDGIDDATEGTDDTDNDGTINALDLDSDGDGISDGIEGGLLDSDDDGTLNYLDDDDDGDGIATKDEAVALESTRDIDGDGIDNHLDTDADGDGDDDSTEGEGDSDSDGIPNFLDANDSSEPDADDDSDGLPNSLEATLGTWGNLFDSDGDGLSDSIEVGADPTSPRNSDNDSVIDALDEDSDNDSLPDAQEGRIDSDEDGLFNYQDPDDDNDTLPTELEVLLTGNLGNDVDGDSRANHLDLDSDGDGTNDRDELFGDVDADGIRDFLDADDTNGARSDQDGDGISSAWEFLYGSNPIVADTDADGLLDGDEIGDDENNPVDRDGDGIVDLFDPDDDADGIPTATEVADAATVGDQDLDGDGIPNWHDDDSDGDGISDAAEATVDADGDGLSDYIDLDFDNDGVIDADDNCPDVPNAEQLDSDGDLKGDACDPPESICDDGLDDDDDDEVDCDDRDCWDNPVCEVQRSSQGYGIRSGSSCASTGSGSLWGLLALLMLLSMRRRRSSFLLSFLLIASVGVSESASANTDSLPLDRYETLPGYDQHIGNVETGRILEHLRFGYGFGLYLANGLTNVSLPDGSAGDANPNVANETTLVGGSLGLLMGANLGLYDWAEIGLVLPMSVYFDVDGRPVGRLDDELSGLRAGAMTGHLRVRLLPADTLPGTDVAASLVLRFPNAAPSSLRAWGEFDATLPRNENDSVSEETAWVWEPRLAASHEFGLFQIAGHVGFQRHSELTLFDLTVSDELNWGLGAAVSLEALGMTIHSTVLGHHALGDGDSEFGRSPVELGAGLTQELDSGMRVSLGASLGAAGSVGVPNYRFSAGLAYDFSLAVLFPDFMDSDGDGLRDSVDGCPSQPEDEDGFADEDGCPEIDNDLDGLEDSVDQCPDLAEDLDEFEDGDGCPDPDNDNDSVLDEVDGCSSAPEDLDGFEDTDGCPDPDNDFDGILDAQDQCPSEVEDVDGFEDEDGCPELDNDRDGIADYQDTCPDDATNQCVAARQGEMIKFYGKIVFETGKAKLQQSSMAVLEAVIQVLSTYRDIRLVEIQGHTDNVGGYEYNKRLSRLRAEAVRSYLIQNGIEPERLVAKGYGEDRSLRSNDREEGRAVNRRVEFHILEVGE